MGGEVSWLFCSLSGTVLAERFPRSSKDAPWHSSRHVATLLATCFRLGGTASRTVTITPSASRFALFAQRGDYAFVLSAWPIDSNELDRMNAAALIALWIQSAETRWGEEFKAMLAQDDAFREGDRFDFNAVVGENLAVDVFEAAVRKPLVPHVVDGWSNCVTATEAASQALEETRRLNSATVAIIAFDGTTGKAISRRLANFTGGNVIPVPVALLVEPLLSQLLQGAPDVHLLVEDATRAPCLAIGALRGASPGLSLVVAVVADRRLIEPVSSLQLVSASQDEPWEPFRVYCAAINDTVASMSPYPSPGGP